jgi:tetratricopeptide (TPR) repeat protein
VSEKNKLQKKLPDALKEKTQYALTFGVIATMLLVAGFPIFVIGFFGIFAYFLWKTFIHTSPNAIREVFEFYLTANEILRNEERRWFGFEIQEVILNGEIILQRMNGAPPLVYFTLGALYNKIGNHKAAVNHLGYVLENDTSDESHYLYATPELKEYVKILRKIEREPSEAPQTSAAIRALERTRRNRGKAILEDSRKAIELADQKQLNAPVEKQLEKENVLKSLFSEDSIKPSETVATQPEQPQPENGNGHSLFSDYVKINVQKIEENKPEKPKKKPKKETDKFANRKPITEVLHEIYDK